MITTAVNSHQGYINQVDSLIRTTHLTLREAIANVSYEYTQRGWNTYNYYGEIKMITLHGIEIKVGDKVWDCVRGWTKVISVDADVLYPIVTTESRFTKEGLFLTYFKLPSLFWQEVEIPAHAFVKPKVMVKKYFVLFERNGGYYTTSDWDDNHYASEEAFKLINIDCSRKFISLILESEIEEEE